MYGMSLLKLGIKQLEVNLDNYSLIDYILLGMQKKVLSEIDLYFGEIASPKGFEINRDRIKGDILTSFIIKKELIIILKHILLKIMKFHILNL
jgi:hypothetical protein